MPARSRTGRSAFTSTAGPGTYAFTVETRAPDGTVAVTTCDPGAGITLP